MPGAYWDLVARDKASAPFLRVAGAADKAAASTERATAALGGATARMSTIGSTLTKRFTVPILAIAGVSVKLATDFSSAMTRIQTQAGASAKDVKTLSAQVLNLSKTAQQGPVDLANALYHLKSVGLDNVSAMKALKQSSDLAAVGGANLEETTNALAGAWRTGIKGATDFHTAAATVNAIIGAGNMTLTDFTDALGTGILASAKTFGLTMKDVGSALALFTDEGVPANAAATRLRMSFSLLGAPSKAAEAQLNSIGLTGLKLADDMRKPNGLIQAIGDLKAHLEDPKWHLSLSEQAQLLSHAFGGGRSSSAILSLINNFDVLKQKQDQVTSSLSKYDAAVAAQKATPAAQFHTLVANLETAGVQLGTVILPAVMHLAHGLTGVVSGFVDMSSATKKFIAIGLGIALLSGPVLALTGKLAVMGATMARVTVGASSMITQTTKMSFTAATRINTAVRGMTAAIGGAAIGAAIGSFTQHMSTGAKAAGVFASAAAGAALGSSGGPWGMAIGAAAGALGSLATAFNGAGVAAISASDAEQTFTDSVKQSINALAQVNVKQAITTLSSQKAYQALDALHSGNVALSVSYSDLADAAVGVPGKMKEVTGALRGAGPVGQLLIETLTGVNQGLHNAIITQKDYTKAQHLANVNTWGLTDRAKEQVGWFNKDGTAASGAAINTDKLGASMHSASLTGKTLTDALGTFITAAGRTATATRSELIGAFQAFISSGKSAADRASLIAATLKAGNGDALSFASAINGASGAAHQLGADVRSAAKAVGKSGESTAAWVRSVVNMKTGTIDFHKAAAGPLITDLQSIQTAGMNAASAVYQHARAQMSGKKAADAAYKVYKNQTYGALVSEFTQLTGNATAAKKLATNYLGMPKHVKTLIEQEGADPIVTVLNKIGRLLADFVGKPWTTKLDANTKPATDKIIALRSNIAAIKQGKFPDLNVNSAAALQTIATLQARLDNLRGKTLFINTIYNPGTGPAKAKPSAAGTQSAFGRSTIPPNTAFTVGERGWEGGVTDAQGRATIFSNAQAQMLGFQKPVGYASGSSKKPSQSTLSSAAASAIGLIGSAAAAKFSVADVGMNRILSQINTAWDVLRTKIAAGLSKHAARTYEKELRHYTAIARHQLRDLRVQIRTSDLHDIKKALGGTVQDTRAAFTAMFHDLTKAGGASAKMLNALHAGEARLIAQQKTLAQQNRQLDKMRTYRSGVRSTLSGAFDPTQYGSIQDLIGGLHSATGTNNAYSSEVTKLRREAHGNKGLLRMINTLDASGQTATLATLAHASRGQFLQAGKAYQHYQGSLTAGSNAATTTKFGESVDRMEKAIHNSNDRMDRIATAMAHVAKAFSEAPIELDKEKVAKVGTKIVDEAIKELETALRHGQHHH